MEPWSSRNMLPNLNTCENWWSNFSANLRVVSLKLVELNQFVWPNVSIYFNLLCAVPRDDVIEGTRFLMRPPVIIPPWVTRLYWPAQVTRFKCLCSWQVGGNTNYLPSLARTPSYVWKVNQIFISVTETPRLPASCRITYVKVSENYVTENYNRNRPENSATIIHSLWRHNSQHRLDD